MPHVAKGTSNNLTPFLHTSLDLILVVSVAPSSAVVIKTTLDFV